MNILCAGVVRSHQDAGADLSEPLCRCEQDTETEQPITAPAKPAGVHAVRSESPEADRGLDQEIVKRLRKMWTLGTIVVGSSSAVSGFLACLVLRSDQFSPWTGVLAPLGVLLSVWLCLKWSMPRLAALEHQRPGI